MEYRRKTWLSVLWAVAGWAQSQLCTLSWPMSNLTLFLSSQALKLTIVRDSSTPPWIPTIGLPSQLWCGTVLSIQNRGYPSMPLKLCPLTSAAAPKMALWPSLNHIHLWLRTSTAYVEMCVVLVGALLDVQWNPSPSLCLHIGPPSAALLWILK